MPRDARVKLANMEGYFNNLCPQAKMPGEVMGMSCAHKGESSMMVTEIGGNIVATSSGPDVANGAEAFQDVRYKAVVMGEDAVINVVCKSGGVDWSHNCWSTIKCLGNAVSQK